MFLRSARGDTTWVLLHGFLNGSSKFGFFIVEICILIWDFLVTFKNDCMFMLSIRRNDFIAHWARKRLHRTLSIRQTNFRVCSASGKMLTVFTWTAMLSIREMILSHPEHTRKWFKRWLNIYEELISSLTEHRRKCLKVKYLSRIEYNFQKFRVTGLWERKDSVFPKKE